MDYLGFDMLIYQAVGGSFALPAGHYGAHISFPDWTSASIYWATAPQTGTTDCSAIWGANAALPGDSCGPLGPQFENLAFRAYGPT